MILCLATHRLSITAVNPPPPFSIIVSWQLNTGRVLSRPSSSLDLWSFAKMDILELSLKVDVKFDLPLLQFSSKKCVFHKIQVNLENSGVMH